MDCWVLATSYESSMHMHSVGERFYVASNRVEGLPLQVYLLCILY